MLRDPTRSSNEVGMKIVVAKYIGLLKSETFIRAHLRELPGDPVLIQGHPPRIGSSSASVTERFLRFLYRHAGRLLRPDNRSEFTPEYIRLLRSTQPDVVLAEYGLTGVAIGEACQSLDIPYVVHFHGFDAHGSSVLENHSETYPPMLQGATAVIGVSTAMKAQLVKLGAPKDRVFLNPCGVDVQSFEPRPGSEAVSKFLAVGRFVDKKAPHLTLLAFAQVLAERPTATLRMIGQGPLLDACKDLSIALGIEDSVSFSGTQPHRVVREAMREASIFVQHSLTAQSGDSEGSPVAIAEAGASGLPVVSTRHAGIPDIVLDEQTGFLVNERSVHDMAERMLQLANDTDLVASMGWNARERIASHFSMKKSINRLCGILEWATGRRQKKPALIPEWLSLENK